MFEASLKFEVELGPEALARLSLIALHLERISDRLEVLTFRRPTNLTINLPKNGGTMPFSYKADRADFIFTVAIQGQDSEGNTLPDISLPVGFSLLVTSSDALGLEITADPLDSRRFSAHVGSPNDDESPRPVTVTATLTRDADGSVIATASDSGVVTVGDAVGDPTGMVLSLPTT